MPNIIKQTFVSNMKLTYGDITKVSSSLSLFDLCDGKIRIYIRYSKLHNNNVGFFGLRREDVRMLDGKNSVIVFLDDKSFGPLFVPYDDFSEVFDSLSPAMDGQYKVQIKYSNSSIDLSIPKAGHFSVECYSGWDFFQKRFVDFEYSITPELSHHDVQSLLGYIGYTKGFDVWIPCSDRNEKCSIFIPHYPIRDRFPEVGKVENVVREIDVIWLQKGNNKFSSLFEVEHSTPIYSGLLRFNDLLLEKRDNPIFSIVANDSRKSLFYKQITRPTFVASGLIDYCSFIDYREVYWWYNRLNGGEK